MIAEAMVIKRRLFREKERDRENQKKNLRGLM